MHCHTQISITITIIIWPVRLLNHDGSPILFRTTPAVHRFYFGDLVVVRLRFHLRTYTLIRSSSLETL